MLGVTQGGGQIPLGSSKLTRAAIVSSQEIRQLQGIVLALQSVGLALILSVRVVVKLCVKWAVLSRIVIVLGVEKELVRGQRFTAVIALIPVDGLLLEIRLFYTEEMRPAPDVCHPSRPGLMDHAITAKPCFTKWGTRVEFPPVSRAGGTRFRPSALAGRDEVSLLNPLGVARRRALKVSLVVLVVLLSGLISNEVSIRRCVQMTRDSTALVTQDLLHRRSLSRSERDHGEEIAWLTRMELQDEAPDLLGIQSWVHPPLLLPAFEKKVRYPWAYAVPLKWPVPFVVRVAHGFAVDGQSGGIGIDYYLTFLGRVVRMRCRSLGMF